MFLSDSSISPSKSAVEGTKLLIIDRNFFFGVEKNKPKQMLRYPVE